MTSALVEAFHWQVAGRIDSSEGRLILPSTHIVYTSPHTNYQVAERISSGEEWAPKLEFQDGTNLEVSAWIEG